MRTIGFAVFLFLVLFWFLSFFLSLFLFLFLSLLRGVFLGGGVPARDRQSLNGCVVAFVNDAPLVELNGGDFVAKAKWWIQFGSHDASITMVSEEGEKRNGRENE